MDLILIATAVIFFWNLFFLYKGAVGRIERKNQITGEYEDLGPVSHKEELAFLEGTHKRLAFFQAFLGALLCLSFPQALAGCLRRLARI